MNPELRELYQSVIIDHGKNPRHFKEIEGYTHKLEGYNPLCGDRLVLYLKVKDGIIREVGFTGSGCAISMASSSLMSEAIKGKTVREAETLYRHFHNMLTGNDPGAGGGELDKLAVLEGVKEFPTRIKCATLAWHTLKHALQNDEQPVTTE
jgi:nitrogen fixation NifU-like protein